MVEEREEGGLEIVGEKLEDGVFEVEWVVEWRRLKVFCFSLSRSLSLYIYICMSLGEGMFCVVGGVSEGGGVLGGGELQR